MLLSLLLGVYDPSSAVSEPTSDPLIDWLKNNASAVGILAFLVVALMKGWLVTGRENSALRAERDRAIDLVYKQADITNRALDASERRGVTP